MKPFGCPVTILNTLDPLGKFNGKADEGFLVGYFINSKAFRVFNTRTRKVEENLHITFLKNKLNVAGSEPDWLFDIDLLTNSMNYEPVTTGNQTNRNAEDAVVDDAGKKTTEEPANKGERNGQEKKGGASNKEGDQNVQDLRAKLDNLLVQQKQGYANSTNRVSTVIPSVSDDMQSFINANDLSTDPLIPDLEDATDILNTGIFSGAYDDEDEGVEANLNNFETTMNVSPIPTTRIHKDHPKEQIIGDPLSAPQTRRITKSTQEHVMVSYIKKHRRTNHKDYQNCLFVYFLSQIEPKKVTQALTDLIWIEAMQDELLQFRLQKKDERGIVVRNKARLVAQGYTQEEGIDYDEVFAPVARIAKIEAIRLFFACASFMGFIVYQMDVTSAFLYGTIEEEVKQKDDGIFISQDKYVADILKKFDFVTVKTATTPIETNKALLKDEEAEDVDVYLYKSMIGSLMYLTAYMPDIMFVVCACTRDSPFDLEAFSYNDYAGASLDRKSTTGGCQFLAAKVLWIQNQMLDYGFNFMNTKIHIDNESTICIVKNPVFHSKTKHIEIRYHFIRDSYEKRLIQVIKIHYTDHNVADLLTKAFDFWNTAHSQTVNHVKQIHATVDGKTVVISESSVRSDLHFNDEDGDVLYNNSTLINVQKSILGIEFSTNIASAVICLANGQKFNFSKLIFDEPFNDVYQTPTHTKKVFTNMKRKGKDFSGRVTSLFASMLEPPVVEGEGSGQPSEPQPASSTAQPRIKEQIPVTEPSSPQNNQSTLGKPSNEDLSFLLHLSKCSKRDRPRCQEAIGVSLLRIGLRRVLALEQSKTAQDLVIRKLKKKVRKLEKKLRARTPGMKLFKIDL
ncbi:putative ribonuclease H-like domain-containing protein [Tanacetum coccineum]